tara:strand:- start:27100 stop:28299 length:1200 start_codon:yes stop_codon:yes gene_type:complete
MKTIIFTAELGAGLGHIMPLLRIAQAMRSRLTAAGEAPFRAVFVLHDPHHIRPHLAEGDLALAAPRPASLGNIRSHTASFAEILVLAGFSRSEDLRAGLAAWDDIFTLCAPDALVADHSPLAVLAARGRVPTLVTGNAFNAPPAHIKNYPALIAGTDAPPIQNTMLATVNAALRRRGHSEIAALPLFMEGDARAVFMLPAFDPYGALRDTPLFGTYETNIIPLAPPLAPAVFLYGHANLNLSQRLIQAAAHSGLPVVAHLTGGETESTRFLKRQGAEVLDKLPDVLEIFPRISVVVSHAGAGLSQSAFAAGRPQVVVPIHSESQMIARQIVRLGTGVCFDPTNGDVDVAALGDAIRQAATDPALMQAAIAQAEGIARLGLPADPLGLAADMALRLISRA